MELKWTKIQVGCSYENGSIKVRFPSDFDDQWERLNYVIRFQPPYFVQYLKGRSPVCYIGSARKAGRLFAHKEGWLCKLPLLLEELTGYEVWGCQPRARGPGNYETYQQVESDLISFFREKFGERPLFNRKLGNADYHREYETSVASKVTSVFAAHPSRKYKKSIRSIGVRLKS